MYYNRHSFLFLVQFFIFLGINNCFSFSAYFPMCVPLFNFFINAPKSLQHAYQYFPQTQPFIFIAIQVWLLGLGINNGKLKNNWADLIRQGVSFLKNVNQKSRAPSLSRYYVVKGHMHLSTSFRVSDNCSVTEQPQPDNQDGFQYQFSCGYLPTTGFLGKA